MLLQIAVPFALAQSAPVVDRAEVQAAAAPSWVGTESGASVTLLGGVDRWDTGGGGTGEVRVGAGVRRSVPSGSVGASVGSTTQGWSAGWGFDRHLVAADWVTRAGFGVDAIVQGSVAHRWVEAQLGPTWSRSGRRGDLELAGGLLARGWTSLSDDVAVDTMTGAGARLRARWQPTSRLAGDLSGQLRAWVDTLAPVATASAGLGWSPTLDLSVGVRAVAIGTPDGARPAAPGILASGTTIARGQLEATCWLGPSWALVAEGGPEVGTGEDGYLRTRALVGLTWVTQRASARFDATPGATRLWVVAPDAERVDVVGDFTDWAPVPMLGGPDGWWLDLRIAPGTHEYVYVVDGVPRVPPEASQRRSDGFGGENGVIVVPGGVTDR